MTGRSPASPHNASTDEAARQYLLDAKVLFSASYKFPHPFLQFWSNVRVHAVNCADFVSSLTIMLDQL
jgi:hypothetical protein